MPYSSWGNVGGYGPNSISSGYALSSGRSGPRTVSASAGNPWIQYGAPQETNEQWLRRNRPTSGAYAQAYRDLQGTSGGAGGAGGTGGVSGAYSPSGQLQTSTRSTSRAFQPFEVSTPAPQFGDLMTRYQNLLEGGAGSLKQLQDLQRQESLEVLRNTQAARGLGKRSGIGVSGAAQFLSRFEPQAAADRADYLRSLIGDYARAVNMGRIQRAPIETATDQSETSPYYPPEFGRQQEPAFAYQESAPGFTYAFRY